MWQDFKQHKKPKFMERIEDKKTATSKMDRRLIREWVTYIVVCLFLTFVNWMTSPHRWWVLWVIAAWGLGIALRTTFCLTNLYDEEDEQ